MLIGEKERFFVGNAVCVLDVSYSYKSARLRRGHNGAHISQNRRENQKEHECHGIRNCGVGSRSSQSGQSHTHVNPREKVECPDSDIGANRQVRQPRFDKPRQIFAATEAAGAGGATAATEDRQEAATEEAS